MSVAFQNECVTDQWVCDCVRGVIACMGRARGRGSARGYALGLCSWPRHPGHDTTETDAMASEACSDRDVSSARLQARGALGQAVPRGAVQCGEGVAGRLAMAWRSLAGCATEHRVAGTTLPAPSGVRLYAWHSEAGCATESLAAA